MAKQTFPLGDILYITTGVLLSERGISSIYDILKFMVGEKVFSIQIPRIRQECIRYVLDELPWLADIDASGVNEENWRDWLDVQIALYGEFHEISSIPPDDHDRIDVADEAKKLFDKPIHTVGLTDEEPPSPYGTIV